MSDVYTIAVWTEYGYIECEVGNDSLCWYCAQRIVWGLTPRGASMPLQPWDDGESETVAHFAYCTPHRPPSPVTQVEAKGIALDTQTWRRLLSLCHSDKHHGGASEQIANDTTRWLLEQRSRLVAKPDEAQPETPPDKPKPESKPKRKPRKRRAE